MLVHFNMGTYAFNGDPSCTPENWNVQAPYADGLSSNPETFNPEKLDIGNWITSMKNLGANSAVLTAKHGCGYLLWPTETSLPDDTPYNYDVSNSGTKRDVIGEFVDAMKEAELGYGFYYR